jgi:ADP-ribose pyrophosphatase YjhB (NUDIX family)
MRNMNAKEKVTRVAVRAIICDENNRVLIIKRSNTQYGNNKWCLPGGKVDYGVSVPDNLANEIAEETLLRYISSTFLFYLDTLPSPDTDLHYVSLVFKCEVSGEIKLNDESQEFAWIAPEDMKNYSFVFDNDKALEWFWELHNKM